MHYSQKTVLIELIDFDDRAFVVTTNNNTELLQQSIVRVGLLYPPYLFYSAARGSYVIVCGYRRMRALNTLGWREVPAFVLREDTEHKDLLQLSIYDNLSHRTFDAIEQAGIAIRLLEHFPEEAVIRHYFPLIGLPPTAKTLTAMRSIAGLEPELQYAVVQGAVSKGVAITLALLTAEERMALLHLFQQVQLSSSKQDEIVSHCMDVALKTDTTCSRVIQDESIQVILGENKLTRSQKGDKIRHVLKKHLYPTLSRGEERFLRNRKKLCLPTGVELLPPPFFEGGNYRLSLDFQNTEELRQRLNTVKNLSESPAMHEILEDD